MGPRSLRFHARFSFASYTGAFVTSAILALGALPPAPTPFTLKPGDPVSADNFGRAVSISGDTAVLGAPTKAGTQGLAYVFVRSGTSWSQQAILSASDGVTGDQLGWSVAVDGDTAVLGAIGISGPGAAYVFVRSGTSWTQQVKLTASDGASKDQFGVSVAVSGDTAVIGAAGKGQGNGGVYVFSRTNGTWTQQAILGASDGAAGNHFGASVSVSGNTIAAGASGQATVPGAVYIFVSSGSTWAQQAKVVADDRANGDQLGYSVSLSGDTLLAGANGKESAYVFARTGTNWNQQAKLGSSDGGGAFGTSVSLSGDIAVVGEPFNLQEIGAAFVFARSGSTWTQQAVLTASDKAPADELGWSVSINGTSIVTGAFAKASMAGAGYTFVQAGTNWAQQAKLNASDASNGDTFGSAVAVSGDTAVIGASTKSFGRGAVYVFTRSGASWTQQAKLTASDAANGENFGVSVAISGDTVLVGATGKAGGGGVYVFTRVVTAWTQQAQLIPSDLATSDNLGIAVSIDGDTAVIAANTKDSGKGAAYVFVRSGGAWKQQAKLTASDATSGDAFGRSVSLSGETVLISAVGRNSFQGVAYIFTRSGTTWTQQVKLAAADSATFDAFGYSVSLSGDTALIGAYAKNKVQGALYVFERSGTKWTQQTKLLPTDKAIAGFGISVALEGDTAVAGGLGAVFVLTRSGSTWTPLIEFTAPNTPGDRFGTLVALGGALIAGAPNRNGLEGAADVFLLPAISAGGIVHAASFAHTVAPGSIASVFGVNFGDQNTLAGSLPLPLLLDNVSMTVDGTAAPFIFVGEFQANIQIPFETQPGTATLVVTSNGIPSPPATVTVSALQPGIFTTGSNQAVVLNSDNSLADGDHPAKVGTVVVMYVTGLGALDHPLPTGSPASANPLSKAKTAPTVTIGGANAVVGFAGMSPGFVGLSQINMQIPKLANGNYPVVVKQGGQTSNNPVMSVTQ